MAKIKTLLSSISRPAFLVLFVLTLILYLLEMWRPGFVSLFFPIKNLLLLTSFFGLLSVIF